MVDTPNLGITHITTAQKTKEATANTAFDTLDDAHNTRFDTVVTAAGPFTISEANYQNNGFFTFSGTPGASRTIEFPDNSDGRDRIIAVQNDSDDNLVFDTVTGVSATTVITMTTTNKSCLIAVWGREVSRIGAFFA